MLAKLTTEILLCQRTYFLEKKRSEWEFLWPTTNQKSSIFDNFPPPRSYYFSTFPLTFIFCEIEKEAITFQSSPAFVLKKQFFFIIIVNYSNDFMQRSLLWNYLPYFDCSLVQIFSTIFWWTHPFCRNQLVRAYFYF